ncbi:MAG: twin-arginine translocation signal domain-containing protein [Polyangia bacterium]
MSELDDEALIYDFATQGAHCVSKPAFRVYQLCNGRRTLRELGMELARLGAAVPESQVAQAVDELTRAGLLHAAPERRPVDLSRRRAMKELALTAALSVAAPMVWSIVAPSVAEAASVACIQAAACMGMGNSACCGTSGGFAGTCHGNMCDTTGSCLGDTCR